MRGLLLLLWTNMALASEFSSQLSTIKDEVNSLGIEYLPIGLGIGALLLMVGSRFGVFILSRTVQGALLLVSITGIVAMISRLK